MKKTIVMLSALAFSLNTVCAEGPIVPTPEIPVTPVKLVPATPVKPAQTPTKVNPTETTIKVGYAKNLCNKLSSCKTSIGKGFSWAKDKTCDNVSSVCNVIKNAPSKSWEAVKAHPVIAGTTAAALTAVTSYIIYKYIKARKAKKNITTAATA